MPFPFVRQHLCKSRSLFRKFPVLWTICCIIGTFPTASSNKSLVHVQVSHIRYLNSCGRKVYLQTTDSRISFYGKLSEVQQEPCFSSFIQIHKSYLVNPDYIDHISSNTVFLQGSSHEQLPISRAYQPLVEQWLMKG